VSAPAASTTSAGSAGSAAPARRRRSFPWKAAFFVVAAGALVAGAAWALLGSSLLVVRSIQLAGAGRIPRQQVLAAARISIGTPLIRVDTGAVARRVAGITQVQSAQVRRSWPDAIVITVVPRTPVFAVRTGHRYDVIDSYGVILGQVSRPDARLVMLKSSARPAALRGSAAVLAAGTVVRRLPAWLRHRLAAVRTAGSAVILILRNGVTVAWGGPDRERAKAEEVAVLLRTRATYYDVSDPQSATSGLPGGG
jgi:cell division protein FtsQ